LIPFCSLLILFRPVMSLTVHNRLFTTQHKHPCPGGIRTVDPSRRAAEDPRLKPHGHWDRLIDG
jgi:hypothetical protein